MLEEEFEHIFNLYYHSLCKYLFLFTNDFEMIEDTVQSIFIKVWIERENILITHIKTYLFISARNRILNSIRDQNKRKELLEHYFINELNNQQAEDIIDIDEFCLVVEESINQLPPKTKEVYKLSRESKMSYKDIATHQNISIKTVENHIAKALRRISHNLSLYYKKLISILILIATEFL